jgi:hypothetical protein
MGFCVKFSTDLNWRDSADTFESPHQHEYQYKLVRTGTIRRLIMLKLNSAPSELAERENFSRTHEMISTAQGLFQSVYNNGHHYTDSIRLLASPDTNFDFGDPLA